MQESNATGKLLSDALAGDREAMQRLVALLTPAIQRRVARTLWRHVRARDPREEMRDMVQQVFVTLLEDGGKALRAWDPARGLPLENFVGLLAQHQVVSILRTQHTNPWRNESVEPDLLDQVGDPGSDPETIAADRETLLALLHHIRSQLAPGAMEVFYRLVVHEEDVEKISKDTGISVSTLYQRRSRYVRLAKSFFDGLVTKRAVKA